MEVVFADPALARLESDRSFTGGFEAGIVKAYRKRIAFVRAAADVRDFYNMKSLHYEKLKGDREGQHSMRLNDQWRLILELRTEASGKTVVIVSIVDYH